MSSIRPSDDRKLKPITAKYPWPSPKSLLQTMAVLAFCYIVFLFYLHHQSQARVAEIFGGARGVALLKNADTIEAYRIGKTAEEIRWLDSTLSDYPVEKGPVTISPADGAALVTTLLDEQSYYWNSKKACLPQPGVRLDFIRGNDRLSLLLCFECKMFDTYLNGKPTSGQNFDYIQPVLVKFVRKLFPDDPKIQSLTEDEVKRLPTD